MPFAHPTLSIAGSYVPFARSARYPRERRYWDGDCKVIFLKAAENALVPLKPVRKPASVTDTLGFERSAFARSIRFSI